MILQLHLGFGQLIFLDLSNNEYQIKKSKIVYINIYDIDVSILLYFFLNIAYKEKGFVGLFRG